MNEEVHEGDKRKLYLPQVPLGRTPAGGGIVEHRSAEREVFLYMAPHTPTL